MQADPPNRYAAWRAQFAPPASLRDNVEPPPERLLQAIWLQQRLRRNQLTTLDGHPVTVLHPGFGSVEGGPDFQDAVLQFGTGAPVTGDVEVDVKRNGWHAHGHDRNPRFKNVILHVVWQDRGASVSQPTLALAGFLDAPLAELTTQLEHVPIQLIPGFARGSCIAPLQQLNEEALTTLLRQAGMVRLHNKAARFRARARQVGWEQSLWEGLFRGLGYKHNIWPMLHLAERRARWIDGAPTWLQLQARLLGLSSLLPLDLSQQRSEVDAYVRRVWDSWWREQGEFMDCAVPRTLWRLHGLRPANHPQRRLALAARWLHEGKLINRIEQWSRTRLKARELLPSLTRILQVDRDDFWSWHWTFRSKRLLKPQPLLGEQRVTDLAVNVVLPWLHARSAASRTSSLPAELETRYSAWPAAEDNAVLRRARQRLLGRSLRGRTGLNSACSQQGLLQIVRDFCDHTNSVCAGCRFPELVREWEGNW